MHQRYPAKFNEGRDKWFSRVRREQAATLREATKQAERDKKGRR